MQGEEEERRGEVEKEEEEEVRGEENIGEEEREERERREERGEERRGEERRGKGGYRMGRRRNMMWRPTQSALSCNLEAEDLSKQQDNKRARTQTIKSNIRIIRPQRTNKQTNKRTNNQANGRINDRPKRKHKTTQAYNQTKKATHNNKQMTNHAN